MLGLPDACLFDVLTQTAKVHAAAWKEMFDAHLASRAEVRGQRFVPFEQADYDRYVDCKRRADGVRSFLESREREHLRGKPAPDTFLAGARAVDTPAAEAAVLEDALAGVAAGRAGNFGFAVGVDRVGQADALREHGAGVVVKDLAELLDER